MKIIDLSRPIYDDMPVFPGDPPVRISALEQVVAGENWYLHELGLCSQHATHVNVPAHIDPTGASLDDLPLSNFIGPAVRFEAPEDFAAGIGVVFAADNDFTMDLAQSAVAAGVAFVGLTDEIDPAVERYTLAKGLISFENLINTDQLPKRFVFHGAPLPIRAGDGSPVRAYAVVDG